MVDVFISRVLAKILVMRMLLVGIVLDLHPELFLLHDTGSRETLGTAVLGGDFFGFAVQVGGADLRMNLFRAASAGAGRVDVRLEIIARVRSESQRFLIRLG